jgi:hypothetical protein
MEQIKYNKDAVKLTSIYLLYIRVYLRLCY